MTTIGVAILFTVLVWWASTGAVLYAVGLPRHSTARSMRVASLAAVAAGLVLLIIRNDTSVTSAYAGFAAGLVLWGWHEMSFLTGLVTGPQVTAVEVREGRRAPLKPAVDAVIYHEVAILLTGLALALLSWDAENQVGLWTFVVLWIMRLSAKFNLYLGVPNSGVEFLPDHLKYLESFFCRKSMNLLFPFSVTVATVLAALLFEQAVSPGATPFETAAGALLATLLALAVLEHWLMVVPLDTARLWSWGLASRHDRSIAPHAGRPQSNDNDNDDAAKAGCPVTAVI